MATRTGASMGIVAALAFFALLSLVMFVLFVIFAARAQCHSNELRTAQDDLRVAVRPEEQNDRWEELKRAAAGSGKGVVGYLDETNTRLIRMIGGTRKDSADTLKEKLEERYKAEYGADIPPLMAMIEQLQGKLGTTRTELEDAKRARDDALADLSAMTDRFGRAREEQLATVQTLTGEIDSNTQEVDRYRTDVGDSKRTFEESLARVREDAEQRLATLESDLEQSQNRIFILEEQLSNCRGGAEGSMLGRPDEAAQIDGSILAVNTTDNEVSVGLGRKDHLVLGITFEVYNVGTVLRADAEGNFPPGKASIEVIRIDETTSRARVIRQSRGNPLIEGDLLVNALYDPRKTYVFTVFGNFDTNGDGVPTAQEGDEIRAFVREWGGTLEDDITGNTDFLVLGTPPVLPPKPGVDDPVEVIDRYLRMNQQVERYQDLFETARRTGIPVLNQNRFYTLTGLTGRR